MPIMAKDGGGGDFEPAPAGNHSAVCTQVFDMGIQDTGFGDKHLVLIGWEIEPKRTDGSAHIVWKRYNLSLNEKANLRKDLEGWRGVAFTDDQLKDGFDLANVLGKPCLVNVIHNNKDNRTYANVAQISPMPKGMPVLKITSEILYYDGEQDDTLEKLSDGLKGKILAGWTKMRERGGEPDHAAEEVPHEDEEPPF